MKIAVLMSASLRPSLISEKTMKKFQALGEVCCNETDGAEPEEIKRVLTGADVAITSWGNTEFTKEYLDCAPSLKLVAHAAGSVKPIVSDELFARGVRVTASACELSRGVSETALGLTIASAKNFFALNDDVHAGGWSPDYSTIMELYDITIGVVSCGFAGAHYIELLQNFGVEVLAYDPLLDAAAIAKLGARKVELDELFRQSDIISLHAPSLPATNHMVNAETLAMMKDNAVLINTARGSLIDEAALYEAMKAGKLKYACLDVTDPEPPAADHPLRSLKNVIFTPHLAGLANNGKLKIGDHVYREVVRLLNDEPLQAEVTQDQLAVIA